MVPWLHSAAGTGSLCGAPLCTVGISPRPTMMSTPHEMLCATQAGPKGLLPSLPRPCRGAHNPPVHPCYDTQALCPEGCPWEGNQRKLLGCHCTQQTSANTATLSTLLVFSVGTPGTPPAWDPVPGSRTPLPTTHSTCCPRGLATGQRQLDRAEHTVQARLRGEARAHLTYFSFRITCFHFPSPWLVPLPARGSIKPCH